MCNGLCIGSHIHNKKTKKNTSKNVEWILTIHKIFFFFNDYRTYPNPLGRANVTSFIKDP